MKKYKFTGEIKEIFTLSRLVTLHRICAVSEFGAVKAGDLGGWIEREENLSHDGLAWVRDNAWVHGDATVRDNAIVCDDAIVRDNVVVRDNAWVHGDAIICGNACVRTNARICDNAMVSSTNHILVIGPIGSRDDFITFYHDKENDITVRIGCFNGKIDEFLKKISRTYDNSKHALTYRAAVELAKLQINLNE